MSYETKGQTRAILRTLALQQVYERGQLDSRTTINILVEVDYLNESVTAYGDTVLLKLSPTKYNGNAHVTNLQWILRITGPYRSKAPSQDS